MTTAELRAARERLRAAGFGNPIPGVIDLKQTPYGDDFDRYEMDVATVICADLAEHHAGDDRTTAKGRDAITDAEFAAAISNLFRWAHDVPTISRLATEWRERGERIAALEAENAALRAALLAEQTEAL